MNKWVSLFILAFFFVSCATPGPERKVGSCLISAKHGGPYLVEGSRKGDLKLRDPLRKDSKLLELFNDMTWEEMDCPYCFQTPKITGAST